MSGHTSADTKTSVGSMLTPPGPYCAQVLNGLAREKQYREAISVQVCAVIPHSDTDVAYYQVSWQSHTLGSKSFLAVTIEIVSDE